MRIDDVAYLAQDMAAGHILHEAFHRSTRLKLLAEGQPGQALTYSGISVELASDRVFLDDKRRAKWAAKLRLALAADRLSSERAQSVHGIMQRAARVFPAAACKPRVDCLFAAAPALLRAGCCCCAAKAAVADLKEQASRELAAMEYARERGFSPHVRCRARAARSLNFAGSSA